MVDGFKHFVSAKLNAPSNASFDKKGQMGRKSNKPMMQTSADRNHPSIGVTGDSTVNNI